MKPAPRTILHPDLYPGTTQKDDKGEALRKEANEAYANGDFEAALAKYSESALHDPTEATTWSNRSATLLQLDRAEDAFDDAERCLWLDPAFGKGYLRRGAAEWRLGRRARRSLALAWVSTGHCAERADSRRVSVELVGLPGLPSVIAISAR